MRWIFVRNAVIPVNAVKINISPHFTAFLTRIHRKIHRISYKNSPHHLLWQNNVRNAVKAVNAVKKNNSPLFTAFLTKIHREIHRISYKHSPHRIYKVYSIWFKFTRNLKDVNLAQWTKQWKAWRRSDVGTRVGTILFCKNTDYAVKINNSPRFTAFTAKRCKKYAVKIIFFHRISPHFLRKFTVKPRPGILGFSLKWKGNAKFPLFCELTEGVDLQYNWTVEFTCFRFLQSNSVALINKGEWI